MTGRKKITTICCIFFVGLLGLYGCSSPSSDSVESSAMESESGQTASNQAAEKENDAAELVYEGSMELEYAEKFSVDYYEGGYRLLSITDGTQILVAPEDKEVPKDVEEDVIVLKQPIENLYLVASSVMNIFSELDALDTIRLSGQKEEGWYIEEAKEAMAAGEILYAGKYN